ncbi:hypothetical protein LCGC14_0357000 [marine sediment metagenome]|uniref:Uncharacterized protein n=1 Tax=marine sediment metagenome TaxID=412755 RepID=A0A0F9VW86_9ZZZZ
MTPLERWQIVAEKNVRQHQARLQSIRIRFWLMLAVIPCAVVLPIVLRWVIGC